MTVWGVIGSDFSQSYSSKTSPFIRISQRKQPLLLPLSSYPGYVLPTTAAACKNLHFVNVTFARKYSKQKMKYLKWCVQLGRKLHWCQNRVRQNSRVPNKLLIFNVQKEEL